MASAASSDPPPPVYSDNPGRTASNGDENSNSGLPAYTQSQSSAPATRPSVQQEMKDFDYQLEKQGKPFLVMTVTATGSYSKNMATILEGSPLKGKINLRLARPDTINSVVVRVKGLLITGNTGLEGYSEGYTFVFLDQAQALWSQEELPKKAALHGEHTWPFSIDLPGEVPVVERAGQPAKMFRLPQPFNQSGIHVTIKYEISVKLVRKGLLKLDDWLSAPFAYIPVVQAPPLPSLRRLAYAEGTPLLGPKVDPDGWYLPNSVQLEGMLFNNQSARIECRLFLAKPLSYTRGSIIPLFITLESDDKHALDLLSSPKAIAVRVRRRLKYATRAEKVFDSSSWRDGVEHSQRAVWWPATEYSGENGLERLRTLHGELHLKPSMVPTSAMGNYRVDYSLVLLQFDTPAFKVADSDHRLLLEQPITIVTSFAPGPRPKMSTPPDYAPDAKPTADELKTEEFSIGFY